MTTITHPLAPEDARTMAAMRAMLLPHRGELTGTAFRAPFVQIMESVAPASEVVGEAGVVGNVPGWWCHPMGARPEARILYLHGGAFIAGSAHAHRHLAGQIAQRAHVSIFCADYRLAPEHPFPAALDDAVAAWQGLAADGGALAIAGDSAGGGLALALAVRLARGTSGPSPRAVALLSPWTDLSLAGRCMSERAEADMLLTPAVLATAVGLYFGERDARDPEASPLFADLGGLPPLRIDVGEDEILLDDSVRTAARASEAGGDVTLAVWTGMPHVFQSQVGRLRASGAALDAIGDFLAGHLAG